MAVSEQTPYIEYTANGMANSFALEFDCENQDHLIVLVDNAAPSVGAWSLSNGAVVFGTAPDNGKKIIIQRNTPASRSTNYKSTDNSFRPDPINKDFDRAWWKIQELGIADWLLGLKIQKFRDEVNLTALEETLERAREIRDDTAASVVEVQSNVDQSTILLASTIAKAEAAATSATNADTAKVQAEIAATDATTQASTLKIYVDAAVGAISTDASKQYATLALAEADISNIALNKNVFISEAVNGGYWYKATAGATTLTKSPYDPLNQAKLYTNSAIHDVHASQAFRKNLLNTNAIRIGKSLASDDGSILTTQVNPESTGISQFIAIKPNTYYTFSGIGPVRVSFFAEALDSSPCLLTSNAANPKTILSPSTAKYLVVNLKTPFEPQATTLQVEEGQVATEFVPYDKIDAGLVYGLSTVIDEQFSDKFSINEGESWEIY